MPSASHPLPAWHLRADFNINVLLPDAQPGEYDSEQLYARQLSDHLFELCCIPFLTFGLALGDVVSTDTSYNVTGVHRKSGRLVYRVAFLRGLDVIPTVTDWLHYHEVLHEWRDDVLMAIDAVDEPAAERLCDFLDEFESQDRLVYDSGQ